MSNTWDYRDTSWSGGDDIVGYEVEAVDGSIGKIDEATTETGAAHIVVDTGPWIFGKKRLIPAGAVTSIDRDAKSVTVSLSKDQIKAGPDYDADSELDDEARLKHSDHYGPFSW
jgi:hypothetical protein